MSEPPRKRMVKPPSGGLEEGRGKPARLKTAKDRTPSQQAWLNRQINDPFSAKARAHGYRSRAAYKMTELDDRLMPGHWDVDLIKRADNLFAVGVLVERSTRLVLLCKMSDATT